MFKSRSSYLSPGFFTDSELSPSSHACELTACVLTPPVEQFLAEVEQVLVACQFFQLGCSVFLMLRLYGSDQD